MKHRVPYLIIAIIILLLVIIFFIPVSETDLFTKKYNEQITTAIKKSDTLNTTIIHLNIKNNQLKAKDIAQQEKYAQRIRKINALPVDSQIKIFKESTNRSEEICLKISSSGDTLAEIPINSIIKANILFKELESRNIQNYLLDSIITNQDSIISTLQQMILNQKIQIDLLSLKYKYQNELLQKNNIILKNKKIKECLGIIGTGTIIAIICTFL